MDFQPAYRIAAGRFVVLETDAGRVIGLKAERRGKDHVNHFLLPLEPLTGRDQMTLTYLDPEQALIPMDGIGLSFADCGDGAIEVGEAVGLDGEQWIKVLDIPSSQRLYSYVNVVDGAVRSRIEQRGYGRMTWRLERI
jgi:hypothetical protein